MSRMVLLDANLLIGAFEGDENNVNHQEAKKKLSDLLQEEGTKLAITPLIRYEVLRGVHKISPEDMEALLNDFEEFEIKEPEARRAAELFRSAKVLGMSFNKRAFDVFHYVSAELHNLELGSNDGDFSVIRKIAQATPVTKKTKPIKP